MEDLIDDFSKANGNAAEEMEKFRITLEFRFKDNYKYLEPKKYFLNGVWYVWGSRTSNLIKIIKTRLRSGWNFVDYLLKQSESIE